MKERWITLQTKCSMHSISLYYMKVCVQFHTLTSMSQQGTTLDRPIRQPGCCDTERNPACQESDWAAPATSLT